MAIVAGGLVPLAGTWWLLERLGAPAWLVTAPWWVPTLGVVVWAVVRPTPAVATDDDDDTWVGHAIRWLIVGEDTPRATPIRVAAAVVFGGPIGWILLVGTLLTVVGLA